MRKTGTMMALAVAALMLGGAVSAHAGSYSFNFNSLAENATSAQIQSYMDGVIGCASCVTVTGAVADTTYNGDGHTVGQKVGTMTTYSSLTLGDSDGATNNNATINHTGNTVNYDTFISNTNDASTQISNQITIKFTGLTVKSVGFDYQIFPDGSGVTPDFIFDVNGSTNIWSKNGAAPSSTGAGGDGTATHSPNSGSSAEASSQWIGTYAPTALTGTVQELDFIDWPATIGVDNLTITTGPPPATTPEPCTLLLLGMGLSGLFLKKKRELA